MLDFAICEISGKQYKLIPNQPLEVDYLGEVDKVDAQVLMLSEDGKIKVGNPYLKENLNVDFIENIKADKVRVAKFHAKANYRKVTGIRPKKTRVILSVKK